MAGGAASSTPPPSGPKCGSGPQLRGEWTGAANGQRLHAENGARNVDLALGSTAHADGPRMVMSSYRVYRLAAELSKCDSPGSSRKLLEDNRVTLAELAAMEDILRRGRDLRDVLLFMHDLREVDAAYERDFGPFDKDTACSEEEYGRSELSNASADPSALCRFLAFAMVTHNRLGQDSVGLTLEPEIIFTILSSVREAEYREMLHALEQASRMRKMQLFPTDQMRFDLELSSLKTTLRTMNEADCSVAAQALSSRTLHVLLESRSCLCDCPPLSSIRFEREPKSSFDVKRGIWTFLDEELISTGNKVCEM